MHAYLISAADAARARENNEPMTSTAE